MSDLCHNCGNCHLGFDPGHCSLPLRDCLLCHGKGHTFTFCPLGVRQLDENYQYWMLCHNCDAWHLPDPCRLPLVQCAKCPGIGHLPLFCPVEPQSRKEPLGDPEEEANTQGTAVDHEHTGNPEGKEQVRSPSPSALQKDVRGIHPELLQKIKFEAMANLCAAMNVEPPMQMLRGLAGMSNYSMDGSTAVPSLSEAQQYMITGNSGPQSAAQYTTRMPSSVATPRNPSRDEVMQVAQALQFSSSVLSSEAEHSFKPSEDVTGNDIGTSGVMSSTNQYHHHQMPSNNDTPVADAKSKKPPRPRKQRAGSMRCGDCTRKHKKCTHTGAEKADAALAGDGAQVQAVDAMTAGRKRRRTAPAIAGDEQTFGHITALDAQSGAEPPTAATARLTSFALPTPPRTMGVQPSAFHHASWMSGQPRSLQGPSNATSGMHDHVSEVDVGRDQERNHLRLPLPHTAPFEINQQGQLDWLPGVPTLSLNDALVAARGGLPASQAQWRPMEPLHAGHENRHAAYRSANSHHEYDQGGHSRIQPSAQEDMYSQTSQVSSVEPRPTTAQYHHMAAPLDRDQHLFSQDSHNGSEVFTFDSDGRVSITQQNMTAPVDSAMPDDHSRIQASQEDGLASIPRTIPPPAVATASTPTESVPTNTETMLAERSTSY